MDTKALIDERVTLHEQNKALLDKAASEKRTLSAEEQQEFDRKDKRITEIRQDLDRYARHEAEERSQSETRGRKTETKVGEQTAEQRSADRVIALRAWALGRQGRRYVTPAMLEACERAGIDPESPQLGQEPEMRALSVGTTTAGGNVVPNEMMQGYWEAQKWFGPMRQIAEILRTQTGANLPIPSGDDTANTGEIIAEAGAVTTTADPTINQTVLGAYKFSSKAVIVSVELLQDAFINLPQFLGRKLGERIGRIQNTYFTTGTGTSEPGGVQVQASLGKTAAATNAITFDEIIDLYHSVDKAYRDRPGSGFMVHDQTAAFLRKLKDSQNRYLWEMSLQVGQPDRMFGKPVYINNDQDSSFATNKRLVLYGDFGSYYVRDAGDPILIRADELRVLNHQVVFLAFQRSDGRLPNTGAVRYLRTA